MKGFWAKEVKIPKEKFGNVGTVEWEIYYGEEKIATVESLYNPIKWKDDDLGIAIVADRGGNDIIDINKKIEIYGGRINIIEFPDKIVVGGWHAPIYRVSKIKVYEINKKRREIRKVFDVDTYKNDEYPIGIDEKGEYIFGTVYPLNECNPTERKIAIIKGKTIKLDSEKEINGEKIFFFVW